MKKSPYTLLLLILVLLTNIQAQESSEDALKKVHNPLAGISSLSFHNYYIPRFSEAFEQVYANKFWIRYAQPFAKGKFLMRISVPIVTNSFESDSFGIPISNSGLGDANVFCTYNFISRADKTIGLGSFVSAPTAAQDELGNGKWQAGLAFVAFIVKSPKFRFGGLITWQKSIGSNNSKAKSNIALVQPFMFLQLGGGAYLRSSPIWLFDIENKEYHMPFSLGIGKVIKIDNTFFNVFIEPQYSIFHKGTQPQFTILTGISFQFLKSNT